MKTVNSSTFMQEVTQSELPVLVDFYADWCGPCRMLGPVIEQLAETHAETLKVVKVNVDGAPDLAMTFGVANIPTLLYFQNGQIKGRSVGFAGREELEQKLNAWRES